VEDGEGGRRDIDDDARIDDRIERIDEGENAAAAAAAFDVTRATTKRIRSIASFIIAKRSNERLLIVLNI
jgi:hypothetical protein